ncbi:hypothetical protein ACO1O0_008589 [Amphichorda felina]
MVASHFLRMPVRFTLSTVKLLCTMHLLQTHVFQLSATGGPSMLPSFSVAGDWISIDMTHARNRRRALRVGDIISYRLPYSPDGMGIKRLIGLPGDYVCHGTPGTRGEDHVTQRLPQMATEGHQPGIAAVYIISSSATKGRTMAKEA